MGGYVSTIPHHDDDDEYARTPDGKLIRISDQDDPRSPTIGINRTPIEISDSPESTTTSSKSTGQDENIPPSEVITKKSRSLMTNRGSGRGLLHKKILQRNAMNVHSHNSASPRTNTASCADKSSNRSISPVKVRLQFKTNSSPMSSK